MIGRSGLVVSTSESDTTGPMVDSMQQTVVFWAQNSQLLLYIGGLSSPPYDGW